MMIPYGRQDVNNADIEAVVDVLRSDFLTQGPVVPEFEEKVAKYCGASSAVAVNSATSALHIACLALGVGLGDLVWTTPITFVASSNCALYCGASVDFVDIDPQTYNICVDSLAEKLKNAEKIGRLPKVVIPVHLCGQSCDMASIYALGQQYGFRIIEDASHAIGGRYRNEPIGNCQYSDITVFSFHPVKIITTGEGGLALTNSAEISRYMRLLRCHGISSDVAEMESRPPNEIWNYQQLELGFNYRMTDIAAALGYSQLERLDEFVSNRHSVAKRYDEMLSGFPLIVPFQDHRSYSSYHLYPIRLLLDVVEISQREIFNQLRASGIGVNLHYIPVYLQPFYKQFGFEPGYCYEAERYYSDAITLPVYPGLTESDQDFIVAVLGELL